MVGERRAEILNEFGDSIHRAEILNTELVGERSFNFRMETKSARRFNISIERTSEFVGW